MFGIPAQDRTDITVILDRSGSMACIAAEMEVGFESFIEKQKELPGDCRISLVQFDTEYEVVYQNRKIHKVPPFRLKPRGGTALLDAMGRTIVKKAQQLESAPPQRTMIVTITDGEENSSREFNRKQVISMVEKYTSEQDWQFLYLGANQDAIAVAAELGISPRHAMRYTAAPNATKNAWDGVADLVRRKRCAPARSMGLNGFTNEERQASDED